MDKKEDILTKEKLKEWTDKGAIVTFIKKDGTKRVMKCSTNWDEIAKTDKLFIPPVGSKPVKEDPNSLIVWDLEKHEFRMIIIEKVIKIKAI